jgi:hypothetical protein
MKKRTLSALLLSVLAVALLWLLAPRAELHAQTTDFSPVVGAIGALGDTVKHGVAEIKAKLDALLYPRWEYKVIAPNKLDASDGRTRDEVDYAGLGREGWELVGFSQNQTYVFKRRAK